MFQEMMIANGSSGGGEKPTLLWENSNGGNANVTDSRFADYQYFIFLCGFPSNASVWGTWKKTTLCDKTRQDHTLALANSNGTTTNVYMWARISGTTISFPDNYNNSYCRCYAIYGCNSVNIDYSDIWSRGDVA